MPQCDTPLVFSYICFFFLFTHISGSFSMSDCNLLQFSLNPAFQFLATFSYYSWWRHTSSFSNWQSLHIDSTRHFQYFKLMHFDLMCLQRNLHLHKILCQLHSNFTCYQFISHDRFLILKNSLVVVDFYRF
jgi:hypothetical protein